MDKHSKRALAVNRLYCIALVCAAGWASYACESTANDLARPVVANCTDADSDHRYFDGVFSAPDPSGSAGIQGYSAYLMNAHEESLRHRKEDWKTKFNRSKEKQMQKSAASGLRTSKAMAIEWRLARGATAGRDVAVSLNYEA